MSKEHSYAYDAGYRDGAINYELDHCPACKNVADLQEALEENAKLREELEHFEVVMQEDIDGKLDCLTPIYLTPAQAIEATLGRGVCHNASNVTDKHGQARFVCSACNAWLDSRMLWNPEYPNGESPFVKDCRLNFCPNCGRKVVEE